MHGEALGVPRYFIAVDRKHRCLVVAIRGTANLTDLVTDIVGDPVPFLDKGVFMCGFRKRHTTGSPLSTMWGDRAHDKGERCKFVLLVADAADIAPRGLRVSDPAPQPHPSVCLFSPLAGLAHDGIQIAARAIYDRVVHILVEVLASESVAGRNACVRALAQICPFWTTGLSVHGTLPIQNVRWRRES